jgi:hypothetical protein
MLIALAADVLPVPGFVTKIALALAGAVKLGRRQEMLVPLASTSGVEHIKPPTVAVASFMNHCPTIVTLLPPATADGSVTDDTMGSVGSESTRDSPGKTPKKDVRLGLPRG